MEYLKLVDFIDKFIVVYGDYNSCQFLLQFYTKLKKKYSQIIITSSVFNYNKFNKIVPRKRIFPELSESLAHAIYARQKHIIARYFNINNKDILSSFISRYPNKNVINRITCTIANMRAEAQAKIELGGDREEISNKTNDKIIQIYHSIIRSNCENYDLLHTKEKKLLENIDMHPRIMIFVSISDLKKFMTTNFGKCFVADAKKMFISLLVYVCKEYKTTHSYINANDVPLNEDIVIFPGQNEKEEMVYIVEDESLFGYNLANKLTVPN